MAKQTATDPNTPGAFEHDDFNPKGVFVFIAGLAVSLVVCYLLSAALMNYMATIWPYSLRQPLPEAPRNAPQPRLQPEPALDLIEMRAKDNAILNHYAWVDRSAGQIRVPIERAMQLLVERGLPVRTPPTPGAPQPPAKTRDELPPVVRRLGTIGNP